MFKHVEYEFRGVDHLEELLKCVKETMSEMEEVELGGFYFPEDTGR